MKSWYERAAIIPGRSNTRSKAPGRLYPIGAGPHYQLDGEGAYAQLDDGKWYLDMECALGAISLGYGVTMPRHLGVGSLPFTVEVEAAEAVLEHVAPWASQVRFVRTGSEATHGALMIARRATERIRYWRLLDSYHGWHEQWQWDAMFMYPFAVGEVPTFNEAAAVIIEPPRWEAFTAEWLQQVVAAAHGAGALVIFDEMIYGGRWALGGAVEYFGVTPDLACYGKALGNGAPVAMIVGREALAEHGEMISGTYSGDAAALSTLIDVIGEYEARNVIDWMWKRGEQLRRGLLAEIAVSGIDATMEGAPVHQRIRFADDRLGMPFAGEMVARSIIAPEYALNICRAHSADDIERVVDAAGESLLALACSM